jgi:outer membrane protein assembly factor BamB
MIQVEKQTDGSFAAKELFTTVEFGDQTKPPLLINDYFYAQYGTNNRRDGLTCMNMSGEIMWKTKRDPDFNKGSMIYADGLILATDGAKKLYLIEPNPAGFKPIASVEILGEPKKAVDGMSARFGGSTQNWAPIALADGKLLIRDQNRMMCVKVAK